MIKYLMALDQGTTSSRTIIFNKQGHIVSSAQKSFTQYFPQSGWVEHDPKELWSSQISTLTEALAKANLNAKDIAALGITNQRETCIVWDKESGEPLYNAIVWQDRRMADYCEQIKKDKAEWIFKKPGLLLMRIFLLQSLNGF